MTPRASSVSTAVFAGVLALAAPAAAQTPTQWSIAPLPSSAQPGKPFDAVVTVVIEDGWKVYSLTQAPGGPVGLVIAVPANQTFAAAGPASGPLPHTSFDPNFGFDTEYYEGATQF